MNKIELIKAEIERLKKENERIKCKANEAYCLGYDDAFYDLRSFINSLPEEKPSEDEWIRKHIIKILDNLAPCHWDGNEKARCIAYLEKQKEQMRGSSEKPNTHCDGLEDAAYKYSFDSRPSIYGQVDVIDAFEAGAQWQKEQDEKAWMEDRNGCFWDGVQEGKKVMREQMMEEAVEGEVHHFENVHYIITDEEQLATRLKDFEQDAKVKLIIVKEDEE